MAETSSVSPAAGAGAPPGGQLATATALVALISFAVYVLVAAPTAYLLDSAELAAASHGLGVAHPPGEPVALLWGKLFSLLPLGSVAFRVSLSQAAAGALAAALVFRITHRILIAAVALSATTRLLLALTAASAYALAPGVVISANRPEVYALGALLGLAALHAGVGDDPRGLLLAALLLGLGAANHPLLAAAAALGVAAALPRWLRPPATDSGDTSRGRLLAFCVASLLAGLGTLAYLPLRAQALFAGASGGGDVIAWGDGRTLAGLGWILSAQTFVGKTSVVQQNADPLSAPFVLLQELGVLAPLALFGLALGLLRRPSRRPLGIVAAAAAGALLAALRGGFDPQNPDIRGYLGLTLAGLAVLGATAAGLLLAEGRRPWLHLLGSAAALLVALLTGLGRLPASSLAGARAADLGTDQLLASLPPRAVLLTTHFETAFLLSYQRAVEGRRPDVDWVHLGFVRGPGYAERLLARRPALAPLVEPHLMGSLAPRHLLAFPRPVLLEPAHLESRLQASLFPAGLLWRAASRQPPPEDEGRDTRAVDGGLARGLTPLDPLVFAEAARDRQVRGFFGFRVYGDAALACARGLQDAARLRIGELVRLLPDDERTRALVSSCPAAAPPPLY